MSENLKTKTLSNLAWRFAERVGAQGVKFLVSLVLARLLMPSDYGKIALITVFITILNVFVDSGLGNALIQKKDADDLDFSTVFIFNFLLCIFLYLGMFFVAPIIAKFYNDETLTPVVRVLSLTIVISGLKNVQQAYVSKKLIFKKFFFATLIGTLGAAVLGIWMAYKGLGVWALVGQQLFNITVDTVVLWIIVKWRPKFQFSLIRLKSLFSYGIKLLFASLVDTVYKDIRQLIIGKVYSPVDLAYYNKGLEFPKFVSSNINNSIDSVLFPVLSTEQQDIVKVKAMVRRAMTISSFLMWPFMFGLAATGKTLVPLLLTEKWNDSVIFLYFFCFTEGFLPITTANLNAIKALGRSDYILKTEIIKKSIGLLLIFIAIPFGVYAIAASSVVYTLIAVYINAFPNKKLLGYSIFEMLRDVFPSFGMSLLMFIPVYFMNFIELPAVIILLLQIIVGILVYYLLSKVFKNESLSYLVSVMKGFINKRKEKE
ncbi:MAG: lipopolysaccharide biosynthesis protein [Treponema sp.]|nr:lipopolysaccharide biosynthesis protein [Treponema sp.]